MSPYRGLVISAPLAPPRGDTFRELACFISVMQLRTLIQNTLGLFALCAFSGCLVDVKLGSGEITTRSVELPSFDAVQSHGFFDVEVEQGEKTSVQVQCDDNLQDEIVSRVEDELLILDTKLDEEIYSEAGCTVLVTLPVLRGVSAFGPGAIRSKNFTGENILLYSAGSGNIRFNVQASELRVINRGSGHVAVTGITPKLTLRSSGSGNTSTLALQSQVVDAKAQGSGDLNFTAQREVRVTLTGSGNVLIAGQPEIRETSIEGSGEIVFE